MKDATEQDWYEEYLAPIISIKVVAGLDEAIAHINRYGSHHTDAIITRDHMHAQRFLREVDSASVMVNASPRFADGFEYGLGAEIGISTDKFHARGPVGIEGLTSLKWVVLGNGEVATADPRHGTITGAAAATGLLDRTTAEGHLVGHRRFPAQPAGAARAGAGARIVRPASWRCTSACCDDPRADVDAGSCAAPCTDEDARANYAIWLRFRERLLAHPTLEASYIALFRGDGVDVPPLLVHQLTQILLRHMPGRAKRRPCRRAPPRCCFARSASRCRRTGR